MTACVVVPVFALDLVGVEPEPKGEFAKPRQYSRSIEFYPRHLLNCFSRLPTTAPHCARIGARTPEQRASWNVDCAMALPMSYVCSNGGASACMTRSALLILYKNKSCRSNPLACSLHIPITVRPGPAVCDNVVHVQTRRGPCGSSPLHPHAPDADYSFKRVSCGECPGFVVRIASTSRVNSRSFIAERSCDAPSCRDPGERSPPDHSIAGEMRQSLRESNIPVRPQDMTTPRHNVARCSLMLAGLQ